MSFQQKILKKSPKQQQGVVIVVALFIVALVATLAYVMIARLERDTRRTMLISRDVQAEFYAQGSLAWAMDELSNHWKNQKPNQLVDRLPLASPEREENGYRVSSTIEDMQAYFNLNNLTSPAMLDSFKRLIQTVLPTLRPGELTQILLGLKEWQLKHGEFTHVGELSLVKGMTPALFRALKPFVTVLPGTTPLNVQNAPAEVLLTLSPSMKRETANMIVKMRATSPFKSTQDFSKRDLIQNNRILTDHVTVTSQYFLVKTTVTIEKQSIVLYTLMERVTKAKQATMRVLWQSKGVW